MNRPGLGVRLAGSPRVAVVLYLGYAAVVLGWYEGYVAWWLAVIAVGAAKRTVSAMGELRRYQTWAADWQAIGADHDEPPPPTIKKSRRWMLPAGAAGLILIIPFCLPERQDHAELAGVLALLWLGACLFLGFAFLRYIKRRVKLPKTPAKVLTDALPVAWLLSRAASSPSRAEATRNLPEYTTRLIGG